MDTRAEQGVSVQPIQIGDVRPLFPLVQARNPSLSWARWRAFAGRIARSKPGARNGILVARRVGQAMPCGAICYHLDQDLRFGRIITVEQFIAMDLLYPQRVRSALANALESRAVAMGCDVIRSILPDGDTEIVEELRKAGHSTDGRTLTKHCGAPST